MCICVQRFAKLTDIDSDALVNPPVKNIHWLPFGISDDWQAEHIHKEKVKELKLFTSVNSLSFLEMLRTDTSHTLFKQ